MAMDQIVVRVHCIKKPCCGKPICLEQNYDLLRIEDDHCDCGHDCRNCPPSEGDGNQEFLYEQMAASAQGFKSLEDQEIDRKQHENTQG